MKKNGGVVLLVKVQMPVRLWCVLAVLALACC